MAVVCKICGREYDITLFEFGRRVRCDCGNLIDLNFKSKTLEKENGWLALIRKAKNWIFKKK
ncbi:MAG: hypothetical protein NC898_04895 [Candidatus Omnitrophica bacterium]|nr:hypothetical protein [Candidatus Omnitrophota bacterium]MCM8793784.1 hypothetical protein [Candidatus Omnitrophota bacterium]